MSTPKTRKEQLEELLTLEPNDAFLHYGLAMEYVSAGDDAEAVRRFEKLLEVDPHYVAAYMQAGQALARLGREEEARTLWQRGIEAAQKQGDVHAAGEMQGMIDTL